MRFTNDRVSPAKKSQKISGRFECKDMINYKLRSQKTYMHYNNGIYMGDMTSYKRNGVGVMLLDDGTSGIVDYCYDSPTAHNIFFKENAIASVLYIKKDGYESVLRTGHYVIKIPFYDNGKVANGNGVLIDFSEMKIYHLFFHHGKIIKKIVETNQYSIDEIMDYRIGELMSTKHEDAFKFNLKFSNGVKAVKKNNKINIGFFDSHHNLDGVCFKLNFD